MRFKPGVSGNPKGRPKGAEGKRPLLTEKQLQQLAQVRWYRADPKAKFAIKIEAAKAALPYLPTDRG